MKNLNLILVGLLILASSYTLKASTTIVKLNTAELVVLKNNPKTIFVFKGKNYHFRSGKWYVKRGRRYIAVRPPVGIQVRVLPRGNKIVHVNGRKLYKYKGVWYKKNRRGFVVVRR